MPLQRRHAPEVMRRRHGGHAFGVGQSIEYSSHGTTGSTAGLEEAREAVAALIKDDLVG